jgi:hypothetical protein
LASFIALTPLFSASYQLDSGISTGNAKIGESGVLVNQFTAVAGQETIIGLEIAFLDNPESASQMLNLVVYSDPNNDAIFNDAVLIYSQLASLPAVPTSAPQTFNFVTGVTFTPGDVFYVGYQELPATNYFVLLDEAGGTRSWAHFGGGSPTDPSSGGTTGRFPDFGGTFAKDALIRAIAIPEPASASALAGAAMLVGVALRRRRR